MSKSDNEIARAWVLVQSNWWAADAVADACERKPKRAWRLLGELAKHAATPGLVGDLGCGPLEDFVRMHAPQYIRQIEARAAEDVRFARALRHVLLPDGDDDVSRRLIALGCKPRPFKLQPWQSRSSAGSRVDRRARGRKDR